MNKFHWIAAALCILTLSSCASNPTTPYLPIMSPQQTPTSSTGYVSGLFSRDWAPGKLGFALGIVNTATAEEFFMPFGVETTLPDSVKDKVSMIQLPAGTYRIAYWLTYSGKERKELGRAAFPPESAAGSSFTVASGEVVFIGSYVARNAPASGGLWTVIHQRIAQQYAQKAFSNSYPAFASQPLSCPSCLK